MKRNDMLRRMGLDLPESNQIRVIISSDVANEADGPFSIVHQLLTPSMEGNVPEKNGPVAELKNYATGFILP